VTRGSPDPGAPRRQIDGAGLRQRLADVAASIACTEDQVAEIMERMASQLPDDAVRLRAHAARARRYATVDRGRAAMLSLPPMGRTVLPAPPEPNDSGLSLAEA
jgi:hypothetical protein